MKKITLLFYLLTINLSFSQVWTSGVVQLEPTRSVQFDINEGTGLVTMTMVFPESTWLGIGPGIMTGMGMGNLGDDAIVYNSSGLEDRNMPAGTGQPALDANQDWSVSSDTTAGGERTVVGTRAINTGDSNDFIFPTAMTSFSIIYAKGATLTFGYHGGGQYGGTVVNLTADTLSAPEFENALSHISISPNPALENLNIKLPDFLSNKELLMEVYDVMGKKIVKETINSFKSSINVTNWNNGLYLVKITSQEENISVTKRFVKL